MPAVQGISLGSTRVFDSVCSSVMSLNSLTKPIGETVAREPAADGRKQTIRQREGNRMPSATLGGLSTAAGFFRSNIVIFLTSRKL